MKMALIRGRTIDERDRMGAPGAMVINETMARAISTASIRSAGSSRTRTAKRKSSASSAT